MHSLSFKVSTDNCTGTTRRCFPGRGTHGVADLEVRAARVGLGFRDFGKAGRIVACSSESERKRSNGWSGSRSSSPSPGPGPKPSSFLSRSQSYALLKQQMEVAAKSEVRNFGKRIFVEFLSFAFLSHQNGGLKF
jgi:ApaG protein